MNNHLDNEISVTGELTDTGFKGSIKSRAASAFDRLAGSFIDWPTALIEGKTAKRRAKDAAEVKMINAAGERAAILIGEDDELARRAITQLIGNAVRRQINKETVAVLALEDLRNSEANGQELPEGPGELSPEFLDRFERYAEDATTDELRERWGRVLASEIRKPGTFSRKVMRAVDELDIATALAFERICAHRINESSILKQFVGELDFETANLLVESGLLTDPGLGQVRQYLSRTVADREIHLIGVGEWVVGVDAEFQPSGFNDPLFTKDDRSLGLKVYVLTNVGVALASIIPNQIAATHDELVREIRRRIPDKSHLFCLIDGKLVDARDEP